MLVALGGMRQWASMTAYGDLAVPVSLPAAAHALHAAPLAWLGGSVPQAAALLHGGDLDAASARIAALPDTAQARDLRGRLAEAQGDNRTALRDDIGALDIVRAQALIDVLASTDYRAALDAQQQMVDALAADPSATEVTANAWWRLGQLRAQAGYREPAARAVQWRASEDAYAHALMLAPNEETYLLAIGYQQLANGEKAASLASYRRAAEVVPKSADAIGGIALAEAASGDCAAARASYARFETLRAPNVMDVRDDPLLGVLLHPCLAQ